MRKFRLNICSIGDPYSFKTWSGTPFNIMVELKNQDRLGSAFDSNVMTNYPALLTLKILSKIYYRTAIDLNRGSLIRYFNAKKCTYLTGQSISNMTLHTSTLDLPFRNFPKNQRHYLYCDSTWNLRFNFLRNADRYSERLLSDAEFLEKKSYDQMEHLFPISEYVKMNLIDHYKIDPGKITVVGTGLGAVKPYYGDKQYSRNKILFAAKREFAEKGGYLVLDAFRIASQKNPDIELTILGQDKYTEQLKSPNITIHGFIPEDKLQGIFNDSSLFIMPAYYEPWGLVYLEAMACKTPIVGFNRNSFPEISGYGSYGFGLESDDPEELAMIILNALADPQNLSEMGLRAQEFCLNKFSWTNVVLKIVQTIEKFQ